MNRSKLSFDSTNSTKMRSGPVLSETSRVLYHAGARTYHPTLQRFLSEDPANYAGGGANLFAYSGNGPVGASDPSGLDSCPDGDCGGGQPSNAPSYSAPGGIFVLFAQILQAIFGISPTSTAPPANHSNLQDIKQADLTHQTAGVEISGGPNLYAQGGDPKRLPDLYTFTANFGELYGPTVHITIDRNGHVYVGGGFQVGKSLALRSYSLTGGVLNQGPPPTPLQIENFSTGVSVDCGAGMQGGGGDYQYSISTRSSGKSVGFFSPQVGCAVTASIELW